jgi:hypothetical protein
MINLRSLLIALTATGLLVGCGKKSEKAETPEAAAPTPAKTTEAKPETTPAQTAEAVQEIPTAPVSSKVPPSVDRMVKDADSALKTKRYEDVGQLYVALMMAQRATKDPRQFEAQQEAIFQIKNKIADAAAAGDPKARQLLRDMRSASGH